MKSLSSYPRLFHALRVGWWFIKAEELPYHGAGSHGLIAHDGVDEGLQTLYPVVDEAAAEVVAEPFLPRQYQGTVREERSEFVVQSHKVGVASQYQPACVGDAVFDA